MSDPLVTAIENAIDNTLADARAVVPGKVSKVTKADGGERSVDFDPGIGKRQGGEERADGTVPGAAVMYPAGGGFSMVWPLEPDDEGLGLVADRNVQRWRQNRKVGQAHSLERAHNVSDALILPVAITAPEPAPANVDGDWVLTGPQGEAIRIGGGDGSVLISRGGSPAASVELEASGSITITVASGQAVNIGGSGAGALALADQLVTAIDAFIDALVAAGAGQAYAGAGAAKTAWEGLKNTIAAQKAKGV
jgi:hypothetical protein